ncbi:MAG: hypothetical protein V4550_05850 [Gemmatimonadota bacterium]
MSALSSSSALLITDAVIANVDGLMIVPHLTDSTVTRLAAFLRALTDPAARTLATTVPSRVPSGIPVGPP